MFAKSSIKLRKFFLILMTVTLSALGIVAVAKFKNKPTAESIASSSSPQVAVAQDKPATRVPSHLLTLRSNGFEPAEVNWPKGQFFLMIDNRSSVPDITLRLDRKDGGGRLKEVNLNMQKKRSAGVFDPPPGNYVLTVVDHPSWVCNVTISPK